MNIVHVIVVACLCGLAESISGGTSTTIKKHPFQAAILGLNDQTYYYLGSGSIIGKKWILTSAYLIRTYNTSVLKVRVGSDDYSTGGQVLLIDDIIVHQKFKPYSYDVALLKLRSRIKFNKSVKSIKLATAGGRNGTSALLTGWGVTSYLSAQDNKEHLSGTLSNKLMKGTLKMVDRKTCQKPYTIPILDRTNSCALNPEVCACYVDYGDPLVQRNKLIGYFIGGDLCCLEGYPQIFCNVPSIQKWVKRQMRNHKD